MNLRLPALLCAGLLVSSRTPARGDDIDYVKDVTFALEAIEEQCGHFFALKDIHWKKVSAEILAESRKCKTATDHYRVLLRLIARLRDGHAEVQPLPPAEGVPYPEEWSTPRTGSGMFWCKIGTKYHVKIALAGAAASGVEAGMEILKVNDTPVAKWVDQRKAELCDRYSFSTDHHALFTTLSEGLDDVPGARIELEVRDDRGKRKKKTVTYTRSNLFGRGPAVLPEPGEWAADLYVARIEPDIGYVFVRRCKGDLPEQMDAALARLGDVNGMILDFRGNTGGGFDHAALFGRFVPAGQTLEFNNSYASAGPNPYAGPLVVLVNGATVSAGETGSGMFKEDGRAYMIGESPTAGMSSSKTLIELPSGWFALKVSIDSNGRRYNGGRGIEGIGVIPHAIVEHDASLLAEGKDALIEAAREVLARFPPAEVPYDPAEHGWKPHSR